MSDEIETIKDRLDIAEVIGEYVSLKRTGQNFKALCPFHKEKTPSFIVSPGRSTWHCFGCNKGGDVISFVQEIEGIDFPATLKMLADRAGVRLHEYSMSSSSKRQRLFDCITSAEHFYHEVLMRQRAGEKAREYVRSRGMQQKTIEEFRVGYAPNSWDLAQKWLHSRGFTHEEMIEVGVVGKNEKGKLYDRFRGRIIFPVTDMQGRTIAFGGRIVPWHETKHEGKYVNTPETRLYEKRRVIYNLSRAKHALRGKQPCIVVEGYMDVALVWQAGYTNVVSASGTAFTPEQVQQLSKFTNTLHFSFDADSAGVKATLSATSTALVGGMHVMTIVLPSGSDPADLAHKSPQELSYAMSHPRSLVSVLLDRMKNTHDAVSQEEHLTALLPLLQHVRNPIQQGQMIQEVAHTLHVPEARIFDALQRVLPERQPVGLQEGDEYAYGAQEKSDELLESMLLGLLILDSSVRSMIFEYLEPRMFLDPRSQVLYNSMQQLAEQDGAFLAMSGEDIIDALDAQHVPFAQAARAVAEELIQTSSNTVVQEGRQLFRSLQRRRLMSQLTELQHKLAHRTGTQQKRVLQQFKTLTEQLAHIDSP